MGGYSGLSGIKLPELESVKRMKESKTKVKGKKLREGGPGSGRRSSGTDEDQYKVYGSKVDKHLSRSDFHKGQAEHFQRLAKLHSSASSAHQKAAYAQNNYGTGGGAKYGPDDAQKLSVKANGLSKAIGSLKYATR